MSSNIIAGDSTNPLQFTADSSGAMTLQVGPAGGKVNAISIDAAGGVTMLKPVTELGVVAFSASATAGTSIPTGTNTKILFQTTDIDTTSAFSSSRFAPTVSGYYFIKGNMSLTGPIAAGVTFTGFLVKNIYSIANTIASVTSTTTSNEYPMIEVSGLVYLTGSADYVEVWGSHNAGSTLTSATSSKFQGFLIAKA